MVARDKAFCLGEGGGVPKDFKGPGHNLGHPVL